MTVSQSVPQAKIKVIKRKVIYETSNFPHQQKGLKCGNMKGTIPPHNVIESIVLIFSLENNLLIFTEKIKVKL